MNESIFFFFLNSDFSHWVRSNEDSFASRVTQEQSNDSFPRTEALSPPGRLGGVSGETLGCGLSKEPELMKELWKYTELKCC